jgi:hypothetical protein
VEVGHTAAEEDNPEAGDTAGVVDSALGAVANLAVAVDTDSVVDIGSVAVRNLDHPEAELASLYSCQSSAQEKRD